MLLGIVILINIAGLSQDSITKKFISYQILSNHPKRSLLIKAKDSNWFAIYNKETKEIYQIAVSNKKNSTYQLLFVKGQLLRGVLTFKPASGRNRHRTYRFDFYNDLLVGDTNVENIHSKEIANVLITSKIFYTIVQQYLEQLK